jgi:hypothetical protein
MDGYICDFSVDHPRRCFALVKLCIPSYFYFFEISTILFIIFYPFVTGGLTLSLICHPHMHPYGMFLNSTGHQYTMPKK